MTKTLRRCAMLMGTASAIRKELSEHFYRAFCPGRNHNHEKEHDPQSYRCRHAQRGGRHISIRCRKISKYSYMLQISVSICRFSEMTFFSVLIFRVWSVTA